MKKELVALLIFIGLIIVYFNVKAEFVNVYSLLLIPCIIYLIRKVWKLEKSELENEVYVKFKN